MYNLPDQEKINFMEVLMSKFKKFMTNAVLTVSGLALTAPAYAVVTIPSIDETNMETAATAVFAIVAVIAGLLVALRFFKKV